MVVLQNLLNVNRSFLARLKDVREGFTAKFSVDEESNDGVGHTRLGIDFRVRKLEDLVRGSHLESLLPVVMGD